MERLTPQQERQAINAFVDYRFPDGVPDGYADGCRVLYHEEDGFTTYEVVDFAGHGDGSGVRTQA